MNVAITYLIHEEKILFLYKNTRKYYVGPGGKQENSETLYETAKREFEEETGLIVEPILASISKIRTDANIDSSCNIKGLQLYAFFATKFKGTLLNRTPEGILAWKNIDEIEDLPMFSGDKILLQKLLVEIKAEMPIKLKHASFDYQNNYKELISYKIDGDENHA
ncbi:MAG: NUDIX domain-containing protein [Culicoidibacterales bacterium]